MDGLIGTQDDVAYAIFDQAVLDAATAAGVARYKQKIPGSTKKQSPHWNADIVAAMVEEGKVHRADSIAELAAALGLPADQLEARSTRYNAAPARARTPTTSRTRSSSSRSPADRSTARRSARRPCASRRAGCASTATPGCCRGGRDPMPGLFAAGESTGGVVGPRYVGSGNSYANCVTFGRIAGASAARTSAGA